MRLKILNQNKLIRNLYKIILFFVINCLLNYSLYSSNSQLKFQTLTVQDGLSHNTIRNINQDHLGFLWFCTFEGLCRYDGYNFKVYKPNPNDTLSLSHNIVQTTFEDANHNLWIGTAEGLNKFIRDTETFINYFPVLDDPNSISHKSISTICEDSLGNVWIGTMGGGLNCYCKDSNSFRRFLHDKNNEHGLSHNNIRVLYCDHKNRLWIGTDNGGLSSFNPVSKKFITYKHDSQDRNSLGHNVIMDIVEDNFGNLWIGTWGGGLNKFNPETGKFTRFQINSKNPQSISSNIITSLIIDHDNILWIGTWTDGISRLKLNNNAAFSPETAVFEKYIYDRNDDLSISTNIVWSVFEDRSGIIWIGTEAGGLCKVIPNSEKFVHIKSSPNDPNSLTSNNISILFNDSFGRIWAGTKLDGITIFDYRQGRFTHLQNDEKDNKSIASNNILAISEAPKGTFWIGTDGSGLDKYNEQTGEITHYVNSPSDDNSLSNNYIHFLFADDHDDLWIGSWGGGLSKYNALLNSFQHFPVDSLNPTRNIVTHIFLDSEGLMWLCAYGTGLVQFNPVNNKMKFYLSDRFEKKSINSNIIHDIHEDESGNLWIATTSGGLNYFNKKDESFEFITRADGLISDVIFGILEDDHHNLWLTTFWGMTMFNPANKTFKHFTQSDGLQHDIFNTNSAIKLATGEMVVGGINGLTIFHPDSIQINEILPPVAITDFRIFNVSEPLHRYQNRSESSMIELSYKLNVFSFEFAALDFTNPAANKYGYKMEGFDQDWIYTDASRRFATYTNLRGGNYIFRVKGSNSDGIWNNAGTSVNIKILPPLWKTQGALFIYILIAIMALIIMRQVIMARERFRTNIEMERIKAQKTHELDQLKLRFFTGVSHEFRTPLMLIIGPIERMLQSEKDISTKKRYLYNQLIFRNAKRLLRLINQLMDARKLDTGSMRLNLQMKDIIPSIQAIYASFQYQAENRDIQYHFDKNVQSIVMNFDQDKIEKIMFNLLSNAFKFVSDSGKIQLSVNLLNSNIDERINNNNTEQLQIMVEDNGIGISPKHIEQIFNYFYQVENSINRDRGGTGIGLSITKDFVEMHGGHITVESESGKGTRFIIHLPVEHNIQNIAEQSPQKSKELQIEEFYDEDFFDASKEKTEKVFNEDKPLLLIVEDNPELRMYLRYELNIDYNIEEAENGFVGISTAIEYIPDLIICDIMMPVVDGLEFCTRCKSDERTSHIPIIILTARTAEEIQIKGLQSGADEYITKPFNIEILKTRIENLLEIRRALKERYRRELFLQPQNISLSSVDEQFINRVTTIIEERIEDSALHVDFLSDLVGLSRTQFYRKFQGLIGQTPNEFINNFRLKRAAQLLETGLTAAEVTYKVGFRDPSYFSKCFRKQFKVSPSRYIKKFR